MAPQVSTSAPPLLTVMPDPAAGLRAVVTVSGEIDLATVAPLHSAALAVAAAADLQPDQAFVVLLDLEAVTFLDSRAVRFVADFHAQCLERGWGMELIAPTAPGPSGLLRLAVRGGWLPAGLVGAA